MDQRDTNDVLVTLPISAAFAARHVRSLKPGDDRQTDLSKRLSWLLRRGAKELGCASPDDSEGWFAIEDLVKLELFADVDVEELTEIAKASNTEKLRYDLREGWQFNQDWKIDSKPFSRRLEFWASPTRRPKDEGPLFRLFCSAPPFLSAHRRRRLRAASEGIPSSLLGMVPWRLVVESTVAPTVGRRSQLRVVCAECLRAAASSQSEECEGQKLVRASERGCLTYCMSQESHVPRVPKKMEPAQTDLKPVPYASQLQRLRQPCARRVMAEGWIYKQLLCRRSLEVGTVGFLTLTLSDQRGERLLALAGPVMTFRNFFNFHLKEKDEGLRVFCVWANRPNQASIDLEAEVEREASQAHQRGQQEAAQADEAIETPTERAQRRRLERQHRPKGSSVREAPASLAQAARSGPVAGACNLREVMRLLEAGAVAELPNSLGRQPIFEAAASGSTDVTAVLLLHGVALSDAKDSEGRRPCDLAAPGSPLQRMLELFAGRRPEAGELELVLASLDSLLRPQVAHALMELMHAPQAQGLHRPAMVTEVSAPALADTVGELGLGRATSSSSALIREPALSRAARAGSMSDVLLLLEGRADPNECDEVGETPLFEAAARGEPDIVAALCMFNADPGVQSVAGGVAWDTATTGAARGLLSFFSREEMKEEQCEFVLGSLCELMRTAVGHEMRQYWANRRGLPSWNSGDSPDALVSPQARRPLPPLPPAVKAAREAEAELKLSQAPLARAARAGNLQEVLRLLDQSDTDPNQQDELGETPLFEASAAGSTNVVAALLLRSADPQRRNLAGGIALDLAQDPATRTLLSCFAGSEASDEEKWLALQAITEPELRTKMVMKLRAGSMQNALHQTLRKLRA
ncbi:unnamed protein product [Polarella glacialis]|uniref:2'-phosphotransferase n=1 Tax=Polarella glacialis TaxID=89957 RepID=A0A813FIA9_POLGL|nr:unnamed protein product [Polarella glacialis]